MFCELFAVNSSEWIIGPQPLNAVLARTMPVDSVTTPKVFTNSVQYSNNKDDAQSIRGLKSNANDI